MKLKGTLQQYLPRRLPAVALGLCYAFLTGAAHSAVNGMVPAQFTNSAEVASSPGQFENDTTNNTSSVVVLPKGMVITKTADTSALSSPIASGDQITLSLIHI